MLFDNEDHQSNVGRRRAFERMICTSSGVLSACPGGLQSMTQISSAQAATAAAQAKAKIPIIVKDRTSFFWRTALAGARKVAILRSTSEVPVLDEP